MAPAALTAAVLPGMLDSGWGRIVSISSVAVGRPESMVGGNAYVLTKATLEAHTVNLAAELRGTGVTANVYRPGRVDTDMQAWIRQQDPGRIGTALHERFNQSFAAGSLISPGQSAAVLIRLLRRDDTGAIWDVGFPGEQLTPLPDWTVLRTGAVADSSVVPYRSITLSPVQHPGRLHPVWRSAQSAGTG